ncbi:polysaccharide pyruvyl transferase family protein [Lachnospiraceae bacterium C1.1]|nr:polysaccharide pyruvyl transferase family protein [Lachnospiraceae bacterium C1.1]
MSQNIMIVGGNFDNKGAQSMLFITIDEIKKRIPEARIFFASEDRIEFPEFKFIKIFASSDAKKIALNQNCLYTICKRSVMDLIKRIIGRRDNLLKFNDLKNIIPQIDLIIDISGFNLGKKWSKDIQESYLDNIRIAKKYNIPIVLMPQSFGPFDYPDENRHILYEIEELLPYARKIYAREKEGYNMLTDIFHLKNVDLSTDLVLQNSGINIENIYLNPTKKSVLQIGDNAVGIVPNAQCFKHGNKVRILDIYRQIIKTLLEQEKRIYVFRHSSEDVEVCKEIYDLFPDKLELINNDFSCLEYDEFVKQFDFLICSRYHGIVHAFRNGIPSILLGWAIKYFELASHVNQDKYVFNITDLNMDVKGLLNAVNLLCKNHDKESVIIKKKLELIQSNNCFNSLSEWMK